MRRVVVTGLGMVTPLGVGHTLNWERLISGTSGIRGITGFDASDLASKVAGQLPRGTGEGEFNADSFVSPKDQRKMDDFIVFAIAAAQEAIRIRVGLPRPMKSASGPASWSVRASAAFRASPTAP